MNKIVNKKFRLHSQKILLTYPGLDLDLKYILKNLRVSLGRTKIKEYVIVKEYSNSLYNKRGKDLSPGPLVPHIHAYIMGDRKINITNAHRLDIDGNHGKYEGVRQRERTIAYLFKDVEDPLDGNQIIYSENIGAQIGENGEYDKWINVAIRQAELGNIKRALELWKLNSPKEYARSHKRIEQSLRDLYAKSQVLEYKPSYNDFILPTELRLELSKFKEAILENKGSVTPLLVGESGIGKTSLIMYFLTEEVGLQIDEILMVSNIDELRYLDVQKHRVIVYDNVDWSRVRSREELASLVDSEDPKTVEIKHGSVNLGRKSKLIISNKGLDDYLSSTKYDSGVKRRVKVINLGGDLYKNSIKEEEN